MPCDAARHFNECSFGHKSLRGHIEIEDAMLEILWKVFFSPDLLEEEKSELRIEAARANAITPLLLSSKLCGII